MERRTLAERVAGIPMFERKAQVIRIRARQAEFAETQEALPGIVAENLRKRGIERLFTHQAQAIDAVRSGKDVVVVTGTNSGKTICFAVPLLERCLAEPTARALLLYPTKALARDQLQRLESLGEGSGLRVGVYDGDTPKSERAAIRKAASVLITNPDMLHIGILPNHENWAKFLRNLRTIVLDEMHVYRGVFGSHVASVLRRLLRLCKAAGSQPQVIGASATIGNPAQLFAQLTGKEGHVVAGDGSPSGERSYFFWAPQLGDEESFPSPNRSTSAALVQMVQAGLRALAFCRSRNSVELVLRYARVAARRRGVDPDLIDSYRAGYRPEDRREIERAIFEGRLLGLASTNALELGVDIGGLDVVLMNGYPGSRSAFWQQTGRAGRGTEEGASVLLARNDPLDLYFARHPRILMESPPEPVSVSVDNPVILEQQLRCAVYERPMTLDEVEAFSSSASWAIGSLAESGDIEMSAGRYYYKSFDPPAPKVDIRAVGSDSVRILLDNDEVGESEYWRALKTLHKGAVHIHRGVPYLVDELNLDRREATLTHLRAEFYTEPQVEVQIQPLVKVQERVWGSLSAELSSLRVTERVTGYKRLALDGDTVLGYEALDLPPVSFDTLGIWVHLPPVEGEDAPEYLGSLHGLEHALVVTAPYIAECDRGDLGSAWYGLFPHSMKAALFVYDNVPGGIGLSERLIDSLEPWREMASELVTSCDCETGCPACLLISNCISRNNMIDKPGAILLLGKLRADRRPVSQ
ncbi:MAG: DEAD/DEAH box helicase [Fimbriimonadaceae bacterium]|nr:MAG: hypothetical protein UZ18_ATM001002143 [Armatimonadetes bacterium OLB18]MCZ7581392.1 DEAD/DEAH box helicase [Fimbriimonadaceae bacterium]WKZ80069.1 MAG: DEAD/DEAH box helicase [Fimbriimonadaceae bacterium]